MTQAKADGLPVLLDFGANWCPECHVLQGLFRNKAVRPLAQSYHIVPIDVGRINRRLELARKYGLDLRELGIPAVVALSPQGKIRAAGNRQLYPTAAMKTLTPASVATFLRHNR